MSFGTNSIFSRVWRTSSDIEARFDAILKESATRPVDPSRSPTGQTQYTIENGDRLAQISQESNTSVTNLLRANPIIKNENIIDAGTKINILDPVRTDAFEQQMKALDGIKKLPKGYGAQAMRDEAWQSLKPLVETELRYVTREGGAPQKALDAAVREIKDRAPDQTRFHTIVDSAANAVRSELKAVGRTPENFDNLLALTETAQAKQKTADTLKEAVAKGDKSSADKADDAGKEADKAWAAVTDEAARQLPEIGKGKSPDQRQTDVTGRVLTLANFGPKDENYYKALDAATKRELVDKPAKLIDEAYERGGAPAAAFEARKQTEGVPSELAGRILLASDLTMTKVATDLGTEAREKLPPNSTSNVADLLKGDKAFLDHSRKDKDMRSDNTFVAVLGDLSAAYETAAGSDKGEDAIKKVSFTLAQALPDYDDMKYETGERPIHDVTKAFEWVVSERNGTVLTLATATQMKNLKRTDYADGLAKSAKEGIAQLRDRTQHDVEAFGKAREPFIALEKNPGKLVTDADKPAAMKAAREGNPEGAKKFDDSLATVQEDGRALWRAQAAVSAYDEQLKDLENFKGLKDTLSKADDDKEKRESLGFALDMGSDEVVRISTNDARVERPDLPGVTPWWTLRAGLDLTHDIAGRNMSQIHDSSRYAAQSGQPAPKGPSAGPSASGGPKPVGGFNSTTKFGFNYRFASSILGGFHVDAMFQNKDFWGTAYGLAFSTATARHSAEFLGGLGQAAVALNPKMQGGRIDKLTDFVKVERDLWTKSTGMYLKGWVGIDAAYTVSNLSDGKYAEAAIFGVQTVADGMVAFFATPKWVTPASLAITVVASIANMAYGSWKAENQRETDTENYLKGADIRPEIAELIADQEDMPSRIDEFARRWCETDGPSVVNYLNTLSKDSAAEFIQALETVADEYDKNGKTGGFAMTFPNDYRFNKPYSYPRREIGVPLEDLGKAPPPPPDWQPKDAPFPGPGAMNSHYTETMSLRGVGLWAFYHGYNFPGKYHRPKEASIFPPN